MAKKYVVELSEEERASLKIPENVDNHYTPCRDNCSCDG